MYEMMKKSILKLITVLRGSNSEDEPTRFTQSKSREPVRCVWDLENEG